MPWGKSSLCPESLQKLNDSQQSLSSSKKNRHNDASLNTSSAQNQFAIFATTLVYTICIYGPMAAMSIGAAVVLAGWLLFRRHHLGEDLINFRKSGLFWPTMALGFSCLWSLVWAHFTELTFFGAKPQIDWIKDSGKAWHLFFPAILAGLFAALPTTELKKVFKVWFGLGVASAVLGIVQHYYPLYKPLALPDRGLMGLYHATGMTGFHLSFASIIAFPTTVGLALLALVTRRGWLDKKALAILGACLLLVAACILTYSKITWFALPVTLLFVAMVGFKRQYRLGLFVFILGTAAVFSQTEMVRSRFTGLHSINDRYLLWQANLEMIRQYPIFGVGWHHNSDLSHAYYQTKGVNSYYHLSISEGFESHAHNNILDQWSTTGTLGLWAFLWWNLMVVLLALRIYRQEQGLFLQTVGLGFVAGWLCLHLNGLTQTNYWDAKVLHQIGWVTAFTLEIYRRTYLQRKES